MSTPVRLWCAFGGRLAPAVERACLAAALADAGVWAGPVRPFGRGWTTAGFLPADVSADVLLDCLRARGLEMTTLLVRPVGVVSVVADVVLSLAPGVLRTLADDVERRAVPAAITRLGR